MEMKNTLKKVLAVVVLVAMAFTLTACGDNQEKAYKKANKLLNDGKYEMPPRHLISSEAMRMLRKCPCMPERRPRPRAATMKRP